MESTQALHSIQMGMADSLLKNYYVSYTRFYSAVSKFLCWNLRISGQGPDTLKSESALPVCG